MWRASAARRAAHRGGRGAHYKPPPPRSGALGKVAVSVVWPIDFKNARELARRDGRLTLEKLKQEELARIARNPEYIALSDKAKRLATDLNLPMLSDTAAADVEYELQVTPQRVQLKALTENFTPNIFVDFDAYVRRRASYTVESPLVRAVTLPSVPLSRTTVVDTTGGLARDAFIIAAFGPRVTVIERHPIIYALLADGVRRAASDEAKAVLERMAFLHGDSLQQLPRMDPAPDVAYMDPMFTWPKRSVPRALPRKEMLISRRLVGTDPDSAALLGTALACARKRVVWKQPLVGQPPAGAAGEVRSANYRFALFSAAQARDDAELRIRQAVEQRRAEAGRTALASFLANANAHADAKAPAAPSQPTLSPDSVASTPTPSTPSSPPHPPSPAPAAAAAAPLEAALRSSAAAKVAAKRVGRAAEEEPVLPPEAVAFLQQQQREHEAAAGAAPPRHRPVDEDAVPPPLPERLVAEEQQVSAPAPAEAADAKKAKRAPKGRRKRAETPAASE